MSMSQFFLLLEWCDESQIILILTKKGLLTPWGRNFEIKNLDYVADVQLPPGEKERNLFP